MQAEKHYIYSIVTFDKENIKVKVDNGKSVDKLKDADGKKDHVQDSCRSLHVFHFSRLGVLSKRSDHQWRFLQWYGRKFNNLVLDFQKVV